MNILVLYLFPHGKYEKVAEAIQSALPEGTPCLSMAEAPADLSAYDLIFAGYWVDRGTANAEAKTFLEGSIIRMSPSLPPWAPIRRRTMRKRASMKGPSSFLKKRTSSGPSSAKRRRPQDHRNDV